MDLSNLVEIVVHYLLIGGMTYLSHEDVVPMVSALVCMTTHWIRPMINHGIKLSDFQDSTNYYIVCTLNLERILNL